MSPIRPLILVTPADVDVDDDDNDDDDDDDDDEDEDDDFCRVEEQQKKKSFSFFLLCFFFCLFLFSSLRIFNMSPFNIFDNISSFPFAELTTFSKNRFSVILRLLEIDSLSASRGAVDRRKDFVNEEVDDDDDDDDDDVGRRALPRSSSFG